MTSGNLEGHWKNVEKRPGERDADSIKVQLKEDGGGGTEQR